MHLAHYFKTKVALKQYRKAALDTFKREFGFYERVSRLQLAHPGLLTFMGAFQRSVANNSELSKASEKRYCIITELAGHKTLA